ncbi:MAG: dienelactone hydrolase family protein [Chloroflexi bacterium]|nr:dienelactone hydrolase family protein [Chloroflexota bacterium]
MCHDFHALPAVTPISGAAVDSEDLVLESADGTKFAAFLARSGETAGPGVVVLPDVRGLFRFYEELALRFAEEGINSVAIDYFGRTAGVGKRGEDFSFMEHVAQTKAPQVAADAGAAIAYLRSPEGGSCSAVFTVGFCFGGGNSWMQAAAGHGLSGVMGFYGRPGPGRDGSPGPAASAGSFEAPVLALMGGADQGIPKEQVDEYEAALEAAGIEHEIVTYEGAPHSFFDRSYEEHAETAADAWKRVLAFIAGHK